MKKFVIILVSIFLVIGLIVWAVVAKTGKKPVLFTTAAITKGDIVNSISSSGSLAALNTVEVGTDNNIRFGLQKFTDKMTKIMYSETCA